MRDALEEIKNNLDIRKAWNISKQTLESEGKDESKRIKNNRRCKSYE